MTQEAFENAFNNGAHGSQAGAMLISGLVDQRLASLTQVGRTVLAAVVTGICIDPGDGGAGHPGQAEQFREEDSIGHMGR